MAHLQQRRRRWYAVMHVPPDVRNAFGKRKFVQSLKTQSEAQAQRLAGPVVAHWKELIRQARGQDEIAAEAMVWREMLHKAKNTREERQIKDLVEERADAIWQATAPSDTLDPEGAAGQPRTQ